MNDDHIGTAPVLAVIPDSVLCTASREQ